MLLSSARDLKAELFSDLTPEPAIAFAAMAAGATRKPRRSAPLDLARLPIAIGLTGTEADTRLAVRAYNRSAPVKAAIEIVTERAKREVDVAFVKPAVPLVTVGWLRAKRRPLVIGCSSGHFAITAGTLGCFVRSRRTGLLHALSNNHVFANSNLGTTGDPILQPGPTDGGSRKTDIVGSLAAYVPISARTRNVVDAALMRPAPGIECATGDIPGLGKHNGVRSGLVAAGEKVQKVGRTTGLTRGTVQAFEVDGVRVDFGPGLGVVVFDNQIEIVGDGRPFSDGGDSGSAIWDAERRLIGLLFAGGGNVTYANQIDSVLNMLDITLV